MTSANSSPVNWAGNKRWLIDRGAIPGEAFAFLDGDHETAIAAMFEIQPPGQAAYFEVRTIGGDLLSQADFPAEAARLAEDHPEVMTGSKLPVNDGGQGVPNSLETFSHPKLVAWGAKYKLPGEQETDVYVLPVSGGADSSALAILMHKMFPEVVFKMIFTDTGAEEPEIYTTLDELENFLGRPIERLTNGDSLWSLIDQWGGFLPSPQARWCTNSLKREPFEKWIKQFVGAQKHMFVGIRADEQDRLSFTLDGVGTEMPLLDMGVMREDVFDVLTRTIGIPRYYQRRTRSGCSVCPFQRRSEIVGLLQEKPVEFRRGAEYEKLADVDLQRQAVAPSLSQETGIALNWMSLPLPMPDQQVLGRQSIKGASIFGDQGIWLGAEVFEDGMPGLDSFIFHQRVVTYSTTLAGLKKQLQARYAHLLRTSEVYQMTPDEVRRQAKFAAFFVEAPAEILDIAGPGEGSYTWHAGSSYKQLEHIISWGTRILHANALDAEAKKQETAHLLSWQWESSEESRKGLERIRKETGRLVSSGWYKPTEPTPSDEIEEINVPCPMCHI